MPHPAAPPDRPDRPDERADLGQQVSQAMTWNTLLAPAKTVVELAANLFILNVLSLPQVGILRLVTSAASTLGIWVDLGIDRALPRFIPEVQQNAGRGAVGRFLALIGLVKAGLLLIFGLAFLAFADRFVVSYLFGKLHELGGRSATEGFPVAELLARATLQSEIVRLAPWMVAAVLVLVALGSFYDGLVATLVSYFRQRAWNLIALVGDMLQPTLTALLVLLGQGVAGVLLALVVTPVVSVALAGWQVLRSLAGASKSAADRAPAGADQAPGRPRPRLWQRFSLYTLMSNVLNLSDYAVSWLFAVFLLGNLAEVALYSVGTALVRQALALLYRPLVGIQVPLFTRVRGGDGSLPATYAAVGRILVLILLPGGVGLVLLAHELILVQYPHYADAALVIYILTPCLFLETFLSSAQITLQVYERYRLLLLTRLPALLIIPLLIWAAPRYGLAGAALAVGLGRVCFGLAAALLAQRALPLRYSWRFFGRVALAALAMGGLVLWLKGVLGLDTIGTAWNERLLAGGLVLLVVGAGVLCFGAALRLLGGIEPEDRRWLAASRLPLRRWLVRLL